MAMRCLECGNCKQNEPVYYCTARNEFVESEEVGEVKLKDRSGWKKGDPEYEEHRRRLRQEKAI